LIETRLVVPKGTSTREVGLGDTKVAEREIFPLRHSKCSAPKASAKSAQLFFSVNSS